MKNFEPVNINLLEKDTGREKAMASLMIGILLIAAVFGSMTGLYIYERQQMVMFEKQNTDLQSRLRNMGAQGAMPAGQKSLQSELTRRENIVKQVEARRQSYVDVLGEIENAMPARLMMTGIDFSDKKITLKGYAREYSSEAELLAGLRNSVVFKDVTLASSKLDDKSREVEFTIDMNWEAGRE